MQLRREVDSSRPSRTSTGIAVNELEPGRRLRRRDRGHQGQQGQPGTAGAGRHRRRPLLRSQAKAREPAAAVQGRDLGHHPRGRQGSPTASGTATTTASCRSRPTPPSSAERAEGLGRPAEARIQGPGRPRRRPADVQPGDPGGLRVRRSPTAARSTTRSPASTSSSSSTTPATSCPVIANAGDGRTRATRPIAIALDLQRPRRPRSTAATATRRSRSTVPASGRFGGVYVQAHQRSSRRTRTRPSCGWSTCTPTRARTTGSRATANPIRYDDLVTRHGPGRT